MNKRGAWLRGAGSTLLLIAGALAALASNITTSEDQHEDCCSCLARSRNDFGEPCIDASTAQCVEMIAEGAPVPSSSACLREICVDDCGELSGNVTPLGAIEDCCGCLAEGSDPAGVACLDGEAEACVQNLDNGHALSSTRACFDDVCRGLCDFLAVHGPDAGVGADGG